MYKLAIVISNPIQYHAPLYSFLAKDGRFKIKVFYMSDRGARPFYDEFAKRIIRYDNPILDGYDYVFLKLGEPKTWWQKKIEFWSFKIFKSISEFAPDAVYFHGYNNPSFWPAIIRCRMNGIKVLFRGENEDLLPRPFLRKQLREIFLKFFFPLVDGFLYIGTYNKDFFLKRGISESKLFFVPYSVDNNYYKDGYTQTELVNIRKKIISKYVLKDDCRLFIYTHKLRPTMKPLDTVQAFRDAVSKSDLNATLIMCGDGELKQEAEKLANGEKKIIFVGYLSQADLKEHMLASDIMINPSIEPWGCSVSEGLPCGLAMILSDKVVGFPDLVIPGVNGYVYPCGNLEKLSELIKGFCDISLDELANMKNESLKLSKKLSFATCADGLAEAMGKVYNV